MLIFKIIFTKKSLLPALCSVFGLFSHIVYASCGAATCQVNTDWNAQGVWPDANKRFDLRYEFIDRSQLRAGSDEAVAQKIPATIDETSTRNQNVALNLDYQLGSGVGAHFSLPFTSQDHAHTFNEASGPATQKTGFNKLGDISAMGRYQLGLGDNGSTGHAGVMLGVKLPTGKTDILGSGERALQPGSGTVDFLLGGFYRLTQPAKKQSLFTQLQIQAPMNQRDGFKPGTKLNIDAGYLRQVAKDLGVMVQLNYRRVGTDSGSNADVANSGTRTLSISPGVSYLWGKDWQIYGFVQKPLQQNVNGVQLTSDWSLILGLSTNY